MMNVLLRISDAIDRIRQRIGRNIFWLVLVAALAAVLVVPLYLFQDSSPITALQPTVSKGPVRPASPNAGTLKPAGPGTAGPPLAAAPTPAAAPTASAPAAPIAPTTPATPSAPMTPAAPSAPPGESAPAAPVAPVPPPPAPVAAPSAPPQKAATPSPAKPSAPPLTLSDTREPEPAKPPAATVGTEPERLFQVQLGAFASEQRAHRLAKLAAGEGFPAVLMRVTVGSKVLHRVRLKEALPREQAEALQASVKQKIPTLDPILVAAKR